MKNHSLVTGGRFLRVIPTVCFFAAAALTARAVDLVQEFYLPMPEAQIYQANNSIISGTGSTIASTFSIVVTANGTIIYYDQWEDGYETDLSNPTQPTTQIWGDGNDADGIPPGFAHNPLGLPAGTVITLTNNVTLPRNPSTILWDARDRIAANKAIIITRAAWPVNPGPVFAGAVSVLSTMDYGTNYISPVGQNLTNNLFKYVGMFIMAAQDNTLVTIDPNGNGVGTTNIVLNQGESYLVNGGLLKGGRVTATQPIQADLIIGHVGAGYASDWFTLYPVQEWSSSYYTPVGSAATVNQPAYVYLYNPNTNAITINYNTKVGSGSFSVPGTNGVFQFQMPVGSGAGFVSAGGQNFYALCTVAANNSSDTAYNWGFTLVPQTALTTVADVGWAPGSSDGTVDGSPVWVTTLGNTTVYVDYHGDTNGPITDPDGNRCDTNFTVSTLQSLKIYDPSKNQTGMRVYTVDGTLLTAAWGEDPDVAQPGNPYIDAGTTVLPFPVPVLIKSAVIVTDTPPTGLSVGDTIAYTVTVDNKGLLPLGNTLVIDAPSTNLLYLTNSTTYNGSPIPDSTTGTPFPLDAPGYTIPVILSQGTSTFTYLCKVTAGGAVSNSVNIGGSSIYSQAFLAPPPPNGASVSLNFTDTNGVPLNVYAVGANVFVTMTNAAGNTSSNTMQTISVTVQDLTHGDLETIALLETGTNTGIFRNVVGLPTSASAGLAQQDGILNVTPGDTLSVSYIDPNFGDGATNTAVIQIPTLSKQLYLSVNGSTNGVQDLNRTDPVANGHGPVHTSVDIGGPWSYRQAITINHANVSGTDQTNFPVLINLASNTGLQNHAQASGNDIRFTASDGFTVLPYEREKYTSTNGALVAWVNVPILSHTTDTVLFMYYGNSSASDQQNKTAVWDTNYLGVWHLGQTPTGASGDMADSTAGANNGTSQTIAASAQVPGKIDGSLTLDGTSDYISTATQFPLGQTNVTVQVWAKTTSTTGTKVVGYEVNQTGTGSAHYDRTIYVGTDGKARFGAYNTVTATANIATSTAAVNDGNWHFLVGCRDNVAQTVVLYVDGILQQTTASSAGQYYAGYWRIGSYQTGAATTWPDSASGYFAGSVDEVRVSQIARNSNWVGTEYNNQSSPTTFYSVGTEMMNPTNVTSFAQTPVFALPFTMPSGGTVTITNFITVTNGTFTASPSITAMLQTNNVSFLTLTSPAYTGAAGVTNLVWTGTLAANVTIPAGTNITYVISNGVAGTAFHVNYDSTNAQSVIVLPASTVIAVNAFGVYDAPYPGGNLVVSPVAGSTVYIRANVTDPFGSYDITSLGLVVTGPSPGSSFTNVLTGGNVVTNDSSSKTYEYPWTTGPSAGSYNLAVTAHEGTEGVTAVAAASITATFLDLGTPSTTTFTSGPNGPATNSYPAGSLVSIRVSALDSITNPAVLQTIIATVTSSMGDLETMTLTETAPDTGVYTNSIISTNVPGATNDGILYAPAGSILTASYTDPNSSSFSSSATATVQPPPGVPGVVMSKTILSPSGGQAIAGQSVTFNLQAVNVGSTTLPSLSISDSFTSAQLNYSSASLAPNIVAAGLLTWTNLGALVPGQSTNITVTFTTLGPGAVTNFATANAATATNTSSARLQVNNPALNVTKILLSPTNTPVPVGSNVVFRITIQNIGNTVITTLPLEDTFSGAYYQFVSSTITNNGSGAGSLIWTNLAYPAPLATNAIITNDITMQVVGQGNPANNTATADYAVDAFGNPVPASSSTIGVITAAGQIAGYVYNDINHSGVFTAGDTPLAGVTVELYTDPTGTGMPGTLLQITTTPGSGYYQFPNLNTGHYVVVATDLPGYTSSAPLNNRLAINLTTLTTSANNDFFQYQPSPNLYSTISGTVWNDINGNGTNDAGETGVTGVELDLVQDVNTNGLADPGEPVVASVTTDTNGNYSFVDVTPGNYVIRETDPYGYYSTGSSQHTNYTQIALSVSATTSTNNNFFIRLSPVANNDTGATLENSPLNVSAPGVLGNDTEPYGLTMTVVSYTQPANGGVTVSANGAYTYTPLANYNGSDSFTYTLTNGIGGTATATVNLTVTAVNQPPTLNAIGNLTTNENSGLQTVNLNGITPGPPNESSQIVTITATSSNPSVVPNPTVNYTNPNSTGTLTFTPVTNTFGAATITVVVQDNGGTANGGVNATTNTFTVTINAVNQPPSFTAGANQTVLENAGTQTVANWATSISAGPPDESGQTLTFHTSDNNGSLFSVQPAISSSGTLTYTPAANANGSATVTVYLQDNGGTANGGHDTSPTNTFTITVTAVNQPPTLNAISDLTTNENSGLQTVNLSGITPGPTNESSQIVTITATSSNPSVVPNPTVNYTNPNSTGTLTFTPVTNTFGAATITVVVQDNGGTANGGVNATTNTFTVTINAVNQPPTLNPISDLTINEAAGLQTVNLSGITPGPTNENSQTVTITATSSNPSLIPDPTVNYTNPSPSGTLTFTSVSNALGTATITVVAQDNGGTANGGVDSVTNTFTVTVLALTNIWSSDGTFTVNVSDATGTGGTGYTQTNYIGYLDVQATSTNPFTILLGSLNGGSPGLAADFNNNSNYTWTIATTTRGVLEFAPAKFIVDTSSFSNDLAGGTFSVTTNGDTVDLLFIPNHSPVAFPISLGRAWGTVMRIPISFLLTNYTTDPDGDPTALSGLGASTNGTPITTNSSFIFFPPTNNIPESFTYSIQDVRYYRPGDTVRMATNWITVSVTNAISSVVSVASTGGAITIQFAGVPGYTYDVERTTNLDGVWTVLLTTNAPPHGVWIYTDNNPPQPAAFYRLEQN